MSDWVVLSGHVRALEQVWLQVVWLTNWLIGWSIIDVLAMIVWLRTKNDRFDTNVFEHWVGDAENDATQEEELHCLLDWLFDI